MSKQQDQGKTGVSVEDRNKAADAQAKRVGTEAVIGKCSFPNCPYPNKEITNDTVGVVSFKGEGNEDIKMHPDCHAKWVAESRTAGTLKNEERLKMLADAQKSKEG
jgi:hypothetical protein